MDTLIKIVLAFVAIFHSYILWLEMFAWTTAGRKVFKNFPPELFEQTKVMAGNQGLYNGFLAAGLVWALWIQDPHWHWNVACFFLGCVAVAGIYGAYSADKKIFFVQALPALVGLTLLFIKKIIG